MNVCKVAPWFPAALVLALTLGCGNQNLGRVEGTVTLDGQPLEGAMVTFSPVEGGRPAAARTDAAGRYELIYTRDDEGALIGEHQVSITTYDEIPLENDEDEVQVVPERLPTKYNVATELTAVVESGSNQIDFDLESAGEDEEIFQPTEE
ncbi:MAG: carboxypeptidase-like regulatory domain-containing protein [Planctomycetes bacterium]|nr:carboxypeptidase-like regulatory domain-containing protein [Planctomycetota bacterium]